MQCLQQIPLVVISLNLLSMLKIMLILLDDKLNKVYLYYYNTSHSKIEFSNLVFLFSFSAILREDKLLGLIEQLLP